MCMKLYTKLYTKKLEADTLEQKFPDFLCS